MKTLSIAVKAPLAQVKKQRPDKVPAAMFNVSSILGQLKSQAARHVKNAAHEIEAIKESAFILTLAVGKRAKALKFPENQSTAEVWRRLT